MTSLHVKTSNPRVIFLGFSDLTHFSDYAAWLSLTLASLLQKAIFASWS